MTSKSIQYFRCVAKLLEPLRSAWRFVGITEATLGVFKETNFNKKPDPKKIRLIKENLINRHKIVAKRHEE
jgi:hypothetical protein